MSIVILECSDPVTVIAPIELWLPETFMSILANSEPVTVPPVKVLSAP